MKPSKRLRNWPFWALLALAAAGSLAAAPVDEQKEGAEPPAKETSLAALLPEATVAAIGFPDLGALRRSLGKTALAEAFQSPELGLWRMAALPRLNAALAAALGAAPESFLKHAYGEWVLGVVAPDSGSVAEARLPGVALLIRQPRPGAERFAAFLKEEVFREWPALRDSYFRQGELFLFCSDPDLGEDLARQMIRPPSKARNPLLGESWDNNAALTLWADLRSILPALAAAGPWSDDTQAAAGIQALGLPIADTCHFQTRFEDKGFRVAGRAEFSEPRRGVFDVFADGGSQKALALAPAGTALLVSVSLREPLELWKGLHSELGNWMEPQACAKLEEVLTALSEAFQASFPDVALEVLDGRLALALGGNVRCPVFVIASLGVKDPEAARRLLDDQLPPILQLFGMLRSGTHRGVAYDVFSLSDLAPQPAYGLVGDSIVLASDTSAFCLAVEAGEGQGALSEDPRFRRVGEKLNLESAAAILYADAAGLARPAVGLALPALSRGAPTAPALAALFSDIPDPAILGERVGPSLAMLKTEEKALAIEGFSEGGGLGQLALMAPAFSSLAAPGFQEARTRAMLARAEADLYELAVALEAYRADNGGYPLSTADQLAKLGAKNASELAVGQLEQISPQATGVLSEETAPTFYVSPEGKPGTLTTPIEYLREFPTDVFAPDRKYGYYATLDGWIVFSAGPDKDYDIDPRTDYDPPLGSRSSELIRKTYDPTNGPLSDGDLWRTLY